MKVDQKNLSLSLFIYTYDIYIGSYDCLYFPSKTCAFRPSYSTTHVWITISPRLHVIWTNNHPKNILSAWVPAWVHWFFHSLFTISACMHETTAVCIPSVSFQVLHTLGMSHSIHLTNYIGACIYQQEKTGWSCACRHLHPLYILSCFGTTYRSVHS